MVCSVFFPLVNENFEKDYTFNIKFLIVPKAYAHYLHHRFINQK